MDILVRGRQMGMKIWASEKFQRILASILESADAHGHNTRGQLVTQSATRLQQEDLSQVLRKEKLGAERDQAILSRDVITFKGSYIYIHDIDEKVRPTMVREYQKPKYRGDGEWPQFRTSGAGKCPFVEDMSYRRELEQKREAQLQQQQLQEARQLPRTRSVSEAKMEPPRKASPRKALHEVLNFNAGPALVSTTVAKPLGPPVVERQSSMPSAFARHSTAAMRPPTLQFGGEPAASGIQRSNLTSAIQSQVISSTAAVPGGKAVTSKEVNELKRKVLERSHTGSLSMGSVNSIPSSHRMTDLAGALKTARAPAPQRAAKSVAKEKLGGIPEDDDPYADDIAAERAAHAAPKKTTKKPSKQEAKPGYCENCRDKYDDFEEV
jgi:regulatory subunit for Cdc7p protein kinase